MKPQVVIHGSFTRHLAEIRQAAAAFTAAGFDVIAPRNSEIVAQTDDFLLLEGEDELDPRFVELRYLYNLRKLGPQGFSYVVNPDGYIGKSVAYEIAVAHLTGVPIYFAAKPHDLPVYVPANHIITPEALTAHYRHHDELPATESKPNEFAIHRLWSGLVAGNTSVATGGIIEYRGTSGRYPEILLVKTHKWGGRYSMVGGKLQRGERLREALAREIKEETGLSISRSKHLCTFDQIKNSGYYRSSVHHLFVDYVVQVQSHHVELNEEAQEHIWIPAEAALAELDIEPNARHTLELYAADLSR